MKIVFVMESTGWAGGHKVIFEYANRLHNRHHDVTILSVFADWEWSHLFDLRVPIIPVGSYENVFDALTHSFKDHIKIATWWKTANVVNEAGGDFYLIQDVETSYGLTPSYKSNVLDTYELPLRKITESMWVRKEMARLGYGFPTFIGVGIDSKNFYNVIPPVKSNPYILFCDRNHFLKGPELRQDVINQLKRTKWASCGYSPWGQSTKADEFIDSPTDLELSMYMRCAYAFMSTSVHEGLCMPIMEAMASGCPVVTTDADGNDFCIDGVNCLIASTTNEFINRFRMLEDAQLRETLIKGGLETAQSFDWGIIIDRLVETLSECQT